MINKLLTNNSIKIGEGATSIVYRVENCYSHKGFLCLKILKDFIIQKANVEEKKQDNKSFWEEDSIERKEVEIEFDFEKVKSFYIEFEILRKLNHPNIIETYGFFLGDKNTNPAILLEYCRSNLEKAINKLEDFELVGVIYEICSAMKHIHELKIIHRDLKMTNILLNMKKHVKICDFGIARQIDVSTFTSLTHGIGTLAFMAPELFDENVKYNEKVDVYSFGVVMYFIVTKGSLPKFNPKIFYESLSLPQSINKLSQSIIKRCWSLKPDDRPSFEEIIELTVNNNFMLINGIEDQIPQLKTHLGLE